MQAAGFHEFMVYFLTLFPNGRDCQNQRYHVGIGAPPILEPILVGMGMFTGGTIWVLTHGQMGQSSQGTFEHEVSLWVPSKTTKNRGRGGGGTLKKLHTSRRL